MADPIRRLTEQLARLPGIGEKTATRLALHLVSGPPGHARDLATALVEVTEKISLCSNCQNLTEDDPCVLCSQPRRDGALVCVVSTPSDLYAIERAGEFRGHYHVLHGLLSPLEGIGPDDLRIGELLRRLDSGDIAEVIVATNASIEGEATAMYLAKLINPLGIKVTRIASGIPVGGELEYSDQATIARAFAGRLPI